MATYSRDFIVKNGLQVGGDILPNANATYNLGSPTNAFGSLYLSGNTIFLGDLVVSADQAGTLKIYESDGVTEASVSLTNAGAPTGTFGSASKIPVITVGADGRITNISNTTVAGVSNFAYTAANNTFTITTADGGSFTAGITDLQEVSDALSDLANTNNYIATESARIDLVNTNLTSTNTAIRSLISATNANVDQKLGATASVTLSGDVSGSGSFSSNSVSITTTVADDSHNHSSSSGAFTVGTDLTVSGGDIILSGTGRIQGVDTVSASTDAANKSYVDTAVANVVDSAPETLNTLNELAAALGDDANFAATTATTLGTKAANSYVNSTFAAQTTTLTAGNGLTGGGTLAANRTFAVGAGTLIDVTADAVSVDLSELTTSTSNGDGDYFVVVDTANAQKKLTKANINISGFNNDAGYITAAGARNSVQTITTNTTVDSDDHNNFIIVNTTNDITITVTASSNLAIGDKFIIVPTTVDQNITVALNSSDSFFNIPFEYDTISDYSSVTISTYQNNTPGDQTLDTYIVYTELAQRIEVVYAGSGKFILIK